MMLPTGFAILRSGPTPAMVQRQRERLAREREITTEGDFARDGLSSDGWWHGVSLAHANAARRWVRERLLLLPHMSDAHCDRFIASLDPPKRTYLIRRAVNNEGPGGF